MDENRWQVALDRPLIRKSNASGFRSFFGASRWFDHNLASRVRDRAPGEKMTLSADHRRFPAFFPDFFSPKDQR
jgi:SRSO17 transposase